MHFAIIRMEKKRVPSLAGPRDLPELEVLGKPAPGEAGERKASRPAEAPALRAAAQPAHS